MLSVTCFSHLTSDTPCDSIKSHPETSSPLTPAELAGGMLESVTRKPPFAPSQLERGGSDAVRALCRADLLRAMAVRRPVPCQGSQESPHGPGSDWAPCRGRGEGGTGPAFSLALQQGRWRPGAQPPGLIDRRGDTGGQSGGRVPWKGSEVPKEGAPTVTALLGLVLLTLEWQEKRNGWYICGVGGGRV